MAIIKCPECANQISSKATVCVHCGFPLAREITSGVVIIKMPDKIVGSWGGLFSSRRATVIGNSKLLWEGQLCENACFTVNKPTRITVNLGKGVSTVQGTVFPKRKYVLVQDMGVHTIAKYHLVEVDIVNE